MSSQYSQTIITVILFICIQSHLYSQQTFDYPQAPKSNHSEVVFGKTVTDSYRSLERKDEAVMTWLDNQEQFLEKYQRKELNKFFVLKDYLRMYNQVDYRPLIKKGQNYYLYQYKNLKSSPSLYRQMSYQNTNSTEIINPSKFQGKEDQVSIAGFEVSKDEQYLAFALSNSGSDWREIRIMNNKNLKFLDETLKWIKYSNIAWKDDGLFYMKYDTPAKGNELLELVKNQKLYYHKVGTSQAEDKIVYEIPELQYSNFAFTVTTDEKYLILYTVQKKENDWKKMLLIKDLDQNTGFETLLEYEDDEASYSVIEHIDGKIYLTSDYKTNNEKIISIEVDSKKVEQVVGQFDYVLETVNIIANKIVGLYYKNGHYQLLIFDLKGKPLFKNEFPVGFEVSGFEGNNLDTETIFFVKSYYLPPVVYQLNLKEINAELVSKTEVNYDPQLFETKYVTYPSKDGTKIPMFLTYKKKTNLTDGKNPVLLYGYGGFGSSLTPFFDPGFIIFMNNGGVIATPQIRGGGEFGVKWHEQGKNLNKQNSFDDFIAAAEFLIKIRVTSPDYLAINGGSNGGLLVGAVMTQRPELFKVAIPEMGVLDMLRFDKFGIGYVHRKEYGHTSDSLEFLNLLSYSPVHNVKKDTVYPHTLIITADNDDRVPPLHSFKFAALLQELGSNTRSYVLHLQKKAGHYGPSTISDYLLGDVLKFGFIMKHLGMKLR